MSLSDKQLIPSQFRTYEIDNYPMGITYRKWLAGMVASNSALIKTDKRTVSREGDKVVQKNIVYPIDSAEMILRITDEIITQLEKIK